jgi:DNA-directed RNA polymerases I and III subunit RPAC2
LTSTELFVSPHVDFCGYALPHPSEFKVNLRIQTDGTITAAEAFYKALDDLMDLFGHIRSTFREKVSHMIFN